VMETRRLQCARRARNARERVGGTESHPRLGRIEARSRYRAVAVRVLSNVPDLPDRAAVLVRSAVTSSPALRSRSAASSERAPWQSTRRIHSLSASGSSACARTHSSPIRDSRVR
jgi:hypothetical protein